MLKKHFNQYNILAESVFFPSAVTNGRNPKLEIVAYQNYNFRRVEIDERTDISSSR